MFCCRGATHTAQKQNIGENQIDHNFPAGQGVKERQDEAGGTAGGVGKGIAPGAVGMKRNCEMGQRRGEKKACRMGEQRTRRRGMSLGAGSGSFRDLNMLHIMI